MRYKKLRADDIKPISLLQDS